MHFQGPVALSAKALAAAAGDARRTVAVTFLGAGPLSLAPTRNCTACCRGVHTVDFDAAGADGAFVNATNVRLGPTPALTVLFDVELPAAPATVRMTAASTFPQCAIYDTRGLPAVPFRLAVAAQ